MFSIYIFSTFFIKHFVYRKNILLLLKYHTFFSKLMSLFSETNKQTKKTYINKYYLMFFCFSNLSCIRSLTVI